MPRRAALPALSRALTSPPSSVPRYTRGVEDDRADCGTSEERWPAAGPPTDMERMEEADEVAVVTGSERPLGESAVAVAAVPVIELTEGLTCDAMSGTLPALAAVAAASMGLR